MYFLGPVMSASLWLAAPDAGHGTGVRLLMGADVRFAPLRAGRLALNKNAKGCVRQLLQKGWQS